MEPRWLVRTGLVLFAMCAPAFFLAPGCGAKSGLEDTETEDEEEEDAGRDATPDVAEDVSPDVPADVTPDVPVDVSPDVPADVSPDVPEDVPMDVPMDVPEDVPVDVPMDVPEDVPMDVPEDVPEDVPMDVPEDVPVDVPIDVPVDVPTDSGPCPDADGDGYSPVCDGDCDDTNPLVNPGAFDFVDGIDNDCDGGIDDPILDCDDTLVYESQDPVDYAKAIDICQQTTLDAEGADKVWGLVSAELRLADGTGTPAPQAHSIITSFGTVLGPRMNQSFVFFSSGLAGTPGQPYWQPGTPQGGTGMGTSSAMPAGFPSNKAGCPIPSQAVAFDPVNLKLKIRVPTNAQSFGFDHGFFSAEYPEWACSAFNDMWVALLTTAAPGIANNKNIVFDSQGTPGSVNLNFFDRCIAGPTGCAGVPGFNFCSGGKAELAGTGYGDPDPGCGIAATSSVGGGTGWIRTEAPVMPGEVVTVEFIVWDSSDGILDSSSIFDNFHWLTGSLANPKTYRP